ncbi:MAG: hypothetical protein CVV27_21275 [Candidatus Melainabacteria bacterium HGW-Melainabacteria-1]|nr:MAG: hypothetical protein CVV27_21275 [Candidatus Melainabacteria bacterium HGW-Melainabacteria-1]
MNIKTLCLITLLSSQLGACTSGNSPTLGVSTPESPSALLADLTGVWRGGSSGTYYLRQSGETVLWYGESSAESPAWAQVAIGKRDSQNQIQMDWYDVPKGNSANRGNLTASVLPQAKLAELSHTGSLNESDWEMLSPAPAYPLVMQDNPMPMLPPTSNFSGVWKDLMGARFYLSQHGQELVGYAESAPNQPEWSAILYGKVSGSNLRLNWAGLPKSTQASFSLSSGTQRMNSPNANILMLDQSAPGQMIGMSKWARVN